MSTILQVLAQARRSGVPFGIPSICTAHSVVLRATIQRAVRTGRDVLIEATCNQVNQFGGYTGMTPQNFIDFVSGIAREEGLDPQKILFGGDHLGPNPWKKEAAEQAMTKAEAMVEAYVRAGFVKIHLDASMGCAGEPTALDDATIAQRAARLAKAAEAAAASAGVAAPIYVLGTEVPVPGGADHVLDHVVPTDAKAAKSTIDIHRQVFAEAGLLDAFSRVIAFVVQPGVEFGSENVVGYQPDLARTLSSVLDDEPQFVFEAHSTDYQSVEALRALVRDGYPILKVGPGVTFAYREAAYALDVIASDLVPSYGNRPLAQALEASMLAAPGDWQGHYHGDDAALRVQRHYSYSDRIRYYWNRPEVEAAVGKLLSALDGVAIPATLMHQYLPMIPPSLGAAGDPQAILIAAVDGVLADYDQATWPSSSF
jgi:D-tagatose 6-phosphate 4-epimerase